MRRALLVTTTAVGLMLQATVFARADSPTVAEAEAFIKDEVRRWGEVIRANNIVME